LHSLLFKPRRPSLSDDCLIASAIQNPPSLLLFRKERPVFGKIRYMNYAGCKRKFKIDQFVARYRGASENAARVSSGAKGGGIEKFLGKKRKA
jgi:hypothetical protein